MKKGILIINAVFLLWSCTHEKNGDGQTNEESFAYLLSSLKQNIQYYNDTNSDSVSVEIITLDKRIVSKDNFEFLILETITKDNKHYQAILGIRDSIQTDFPIYTFSHNQESKFRITDIQNLMDSLIFHGTFDAPDGKNKFKLSYDKNFSGKSDPWKINLNENSN